VRKTAVTALALVASTLVAPTPAQSGAPIDTQPLRDAVTVQGIKQHLQKFQDIGTEFGNRQSGTAGFDASADYVAKKLEAAGYKTRVQSFDFLAFEERAAATLARISGTSTTEYDVMTLLYSGSGSVEGSVAAATDAAVQGCAAADFGTASVTAAKLALVHQGGCGLEVKVGNAVAAGYDAMIVVADDGVALTAVTDGQLTAPAAIPVVSVTYAAGADLQAGAESATVRVATDTATELRTTANVIGTSRYGDRDKTLVVGSHLDSVFAGPGINDNGSGSATNLEIARQIDKLGIETKRRLRFAFWGAEEFGLIGSRYYVNSLSERQRDRIMANLNFDMVGSPNYVRFVYDGDGSTGGPVGPPGSGEIEAIFVDYFDSQDLASDPTPFSGRSDYGPFIAVGIPAGGLFTGAEGRKTAEQADVYGGTEGAPYDSCYHQACDTITNVNDTVLGQMSDAAAHTTLVMARLA
jgi:Zn-dependent M28 family amino/carboxypeptidase